MKLITKNDVAGDSPASQDVADMAKLGKKQQFRRTFEFWSILGFSCATLITWIGQLAVFITGLLNGGPAGLIISFLLIWSAMFAIVASLAEMLSMWPSSSGQYHWAFNLAPPRWAAAISYITGWQGVIAWQALTASAAYLCGTIVQGLIILHYPDTYEPERWHGTLLIYATLLVVGLGNTVFARYLPKVDILLLILYISGYIIFLVVITVMSPTKASAHDVFQTFYNYGGWESQGVSWWVGLQGTVFAWLGADGVTHMAEEVRDASTVLPKALLVSTGLNGLMGFSMLIAVLFCGGNLLNALDSPTGYPIIAIFTYSTRSVAGGTGLTVILLLFGSATCLSSSVAASRELWAFARDSGLPGSSWISQVHRPSGLPLWAIFITMSVSVLISLINVGSSVALNAVVSLTVAGFMGSYIAPIALIFYKRLTSHDLPFGPWKLGKWGWLINAYALIWAVLIMVWSFFPPTPSPSPETMNWSCLAYGGVMLFALAFWLVDGRKRYSGPVRDADDEEEDLGESVSR